ncbi:MAG: histidine kinase dimerization/phosphoacceptor domain -containing protein [Candidatus Pacebacteria bacterium]|nr:histidine kinase dimerization/phosphoacceptor domain -containing protein [Candidatus Paceibacterota bacterium]
MNEFGHQQSVLHYRALLHQMRNHLQLVASLLRLESQSSASNSEPQKLLTQTIERIQAIGLAHELIHDTDSSVDVSQYLHSLSLRLIQNHPLADRVHYVVDCDAMTLPLDLIVKLGLMVCEVMLRALDNGSKDGDRSQRKLTIACRMADNQCRLMIAHNQQGLAINTIFAEQKIPLIQLITKQIKGTITVETGGLGSVWILDFPIEKTLDCSTRPVQESAATD